MALKPVIAKQYDEAKLQAMTEPLTVRVEKIRAGQRYPIPLPESEDAPGQAGGTAYDKEAVRQLEQFLVTQWSGGGSYVFKVTDAANQTLEWSTTFPVTEYPEITPPPLQGAAAPFSQPAPQRRTNHVPAFPLGFPQVQQPGYGQSHPQYGYQYPPMPAPPPVGTPQYMLWKDEAKERQESAELRALREANERREREALQERHRAELERERQQNEQRFAKQDAAMADLRNMIGQLTTTIANAQAASSTTKPNSEIEALKLQLEAQRRDADAARAAAEAERRDRDHREMVKTMQESSQKQFESMQRQFEGMQAALAAVNANKQDPMIEMLREQARQSAEAMKEVTRNFTAVIDKMQSTSLSPRDIIALTQDSSKTAEHVADKLASNYGRIIDLQTKVTENALQMQPQGSPVLDMVREGFGKASEMAERFFGRAELQQRLEATKYEQTLAAQRDVAIAQAQAASGLSGQPAVSQDGQAMLPMPPAPASSKRRKADKADKPAKPSKKILGRTEEEWFGPLMPEIIKLREGVAQFLENLKTGQIDDENIDNLDFGISPARAAQGIFIGAQMVMQNQVNIPVMDDLLFQQRFGDLMDVILPNTPEQYRAEVLNNLIPAVRGEVGGGSGMTGEEPQEASSEHEDDEASADGDDDEQAEASADENPDEADDGDQDGAPAPARGGLQVVPAQPTRAPNGRAINAPRRT